MHRAQKQYYEKNGFQKEQLNKTSFSSEFPAILGGIGTVNCYDPLPQKNNALCMSNVSYKGEYYLLKDGGKVNSYSWSPNKITLEGESNKFDQLVVNQNYAEGWHVIKNGKY